MRLYSFTNLYLSDIQRGIQTAHVVSDMSVKYQPSGSEQALAYEDWAKDHKTIIVLNGGYSQSLYEIEDLFKDESNPFPWDTFNEDTFALGTGVAGQGARTAIGIVLPEYVYNMAAAVRRLNLNADELSQAIQSLASDEGPNTAARLVYDQVADLIDVHYEDYTPFVCKLITRMNMHGLA
jgi:hypothetical protein